MCSPTHQDLTARTIPPPKWILRLKPWILLLPRSLISPPRRTQPCSRRPRASPVISAGLPSLWTASTFYQTDGKPPANTSADAHATTSPPKPEDTSEPIHEDSETDRPQSDRNNANKATQPQPKRRALQNTKERRLLARVAHQQDGQDRLEDAVKSHADGLTALENTCPQMMHTMQNIQSMVLQIRTQLQPENAPPPPPPPMIQPDQQPPYAPTPANHGPQPQLITPKSKNARRLATWRNTGETIGGDHCILKVLVPLKNRLPTPRAQPLTDWQQYRRHLDASLPPTPTGPLPLVFSRRIRISPLPKHMHPDANPERRLARAKALTKMYAQDTSAYYVDAAPYPGRPDAYAVTVISAATGALKTAASIRTTHTTLAKEFAIPLALTQLPCTTILSDSRLAILRFATNQLSPTTLRICTPFRAPAKLARLTWFPAHTGLPNGGTVNRNAEADATARALPSRAAILAWYHVTRRKYPPPHPDLQPAESTILRQLQTEAIWTPVFAKDICPTVCPTDLCQHCNAARATTPHLLWDCRPPEDTQDAMPPSMALALKSDDIGHQRGTVRQVMDMLARQRLKMPSPPRRAVSRRP
ncbi:hypothetical protein HPB48_019448 [Haemaphysalis longicornis]|uniref:Tick transposon n=1 Tax=Haemaphysalis longicornis TaxID=44386 RepID=A0A9J6GUU8_HAELO|nr:hypothetical protein HPB48_019448 [Haemaphysalis longicornis]